MTNEISVRVVFFQEDETWVAQCLEYDIAAFAKRMRDLPKAFNRAIAANVCANHDMGREGLEGIPPAPQRYRRMVKDGAFRRDPRAGEFEFGVSMPVKVRKLFFADAA